MENHYRLTRYHVAMDGADVGNHDSIYVFLTRYGKVVKVSKSEYEYCSRAKHVSPASSIAMDRMIETGLLVPSGMDEIHDLLEENSLSTEESDELYVVVQPSSFCQFSCGYCGQRHHKGSMALQTAEKLQSWVRHQLDNYNYRKVQVGWFGAEPLAGFSELCDIALKIDEVTRVAGASFVSRIVTNGLSLTPDKVEKLRDIANIERIEVTLDGPPEVHDLRRSSNLITNTFEVIVGNLISAAKIVPNADIIVRCNVDCHNFQHVPALIDRLTEEGMGEYASLYFAPVHSWGNDAQLEGLDPETFSYLELKWKVLLWDKGWRVGFLPDRKYTTCIATQSQGYVVDASGDVFGCTEKPLVPEYHEQRLGNVDGLLSGDNAWGEYREFLDDIVAGEVPCKTCFALPVCGGACPKEWSEGRSPCPSFKYSASAALRSWLVTEYGDRQLDG